MILECNFFCRTPEEWTALGTWALVAATLFLWWTALKTYRDQRRTNLILQRPILAVLNPFVGTHAATGRNLIYFTIKNIGKSPAFDLTVNVKVTLNNELLQEETNLAIGNFSADDAFGVAIPLRTNIIEMADRQIPLSFLAVFHYADIDKANNIYTYAARYNYELMSFTIGEHERE